MLLNSIAFLPLVQFSMCYTRYYIAAVNVCRPTPVGAYVIALYIFTITLYYLRRGGKYYLGLSVCIQNNSKRYERTSMKVAQYGTYL